MPTFLKEDKDELFQIRFPKSYELFTSKYKTVDILNVRLFLVTYDISIRAYQDGLWGFTSSGTPLSTKFPPIYLSEESALWNGALLMLTLIEEEYLMESK